MFVIIFQSSKIDYTALLSGARQSLAGGAVHRERPNTKAPAEISGGRVVGKIARKEKNEPS